MRVLLFGDSVALTLGIGLSYPADQAKYGYVLSDKGILGCGVVTGPRSSSWGPATSRRPRATGPRSTPGEPLNQQPWPYQWLDAIN